MQSKEHRNAMFRLLGKMLCEVSKVKMWTDVSYSIGVEEFLRWFVPHYFKIFC
jgi:hypothetical protein